MKIMVDAENDFRSPVFNSEMISSERTLEENKDYKESSDIDTRKQKLQENKAKPFTCDECGKKWISKYQLVIHIRGHTGERPFECNQCEKKFARNGDLDRHKKMHTVEKSFKCDVCEKAFYRRDYLTHHKRVHSKTYTCNVCGMEMTSKSQLKTHMRVHTGEKPFGCNICEKKFAKKGDLDRHKKIHIGEKPFKCDVCEKAFYRRDYLTHHKRVHKSEKQSTSDLINYVDCGKEIKVEDIKEELKEESFDTAIQQEIDGIRLYSCDVCQEKFTERIVLIMHMDISHSQYIYKNI